MVSPALAPLPPPTFEAVFRENAPFVWRALRGLGVSESDLADVSQEVFLVVHRRLDAFRGASSLRTWIYGISVRVASEYRRRAHRRREMPAGDDLPEQGETRPLDEEVDGRRALAKLDRVLDTLGDEKRAVLVLFELEGLPMTEVAEAVGCPLQTAYARLYAARKIVRAAFEESQTRAEEKR